MDDMRGYQRRWAPPTRRVPKSEPFDPKTGPVDCGPKPTPPDGAIEEEEEDATLNGPPEGTPQGPPEGTPEGPPEGTPQGPPAP